MGCIFTYAYDTQRIIKERDYNGVCVVCNIKLFCVICTYFMYEVVLHRVFFIILQTTNTLETNNTREYTFAPAHLHL